MIRRMSKPAPPIGASGVRSLMTVNRLLDPRGVYKSPTGEVGAQQMRRRHTIDHHGPRDQSRDAEDRRTGSKSVTPPPEEGEPKILKKPEKDKNDIDAICCQMALRYKLMRSEVRCIIQEFMKAPRNEVGGLQQEHFDVAMEKIFEVPKINKVVSKSAYVAANIEKEINIEKFLMWYVQNMFTQISALTADKAMADSNALAYRLAEKHQVTNATIDKIKTKFDLYDLDRSGKIDFSEFQAMFCVILKVRDVDDLNPERMKRFWSQIDHNLDGGIDFEEFVNWYLKSFSPDTDNDDDWDMAGPLEKFYNNFNPSVQRRNTLSGQKKVQSIM